MVDAVKSLPSGWHIDPDTGAWMRDTIHRMGRRCLKWNYCGKGCYHITLVLNDRSRPLFGELVGNSPEMAHIELSALGLRIEAHLKRLPEFAPEIEVMGVQMMPEHLHVVLRVRRSMARSLGEQLRGFKIGATKIARGMSRPIDGAARDGAARDGAARDGAAQGWAAQGWAARGEAARGKGLFADGFVDVILGDERAIESALAYLRDNPRRLWEKQAHPELFKVRRDLLQPIGGLGQAHFSAIGNQALLAAPHLLQLQCSRSYFAYARNGRGEILHGEPPRVATRLFAEKCETLLAAAAHGAVLVSPCISEGEKEIARRAFALGYKVITLANKGFSPLYKPGGRLFEQCAAGNLLMLAPAGWPYLPGEKKMTRTDACVLNRIAQLLSGDGAVEIDYKGAHIAGVDAAVREALKNRCVKIYKIRKRKEYEDC